MEWTAVALDPGDPQHVLAANMDQLMVVASYLNPTIKWGLIDRYLVLAEAEGIALVDLSQAGLPEIPLTKGLEKRTAFAIPKDCNLRVIWMDDNKFPVEGSFGSVAADRGQDHRLPRSAWSRSIASKRALKLPLPNPCDPSR